MPKKTFLISLREPKLVLSNDYLSVRKEGGLKYIKNQKSRCLPIIFLFEELKYRNRSSRKNQQEAMRCISINNNTLMMMTMKLVVIMIFD